MMTIAIVSLNLILPAHDWYDPQCCGGQDCHPVPCEELVEQGNGDWKWNVYTFDKNKVTSSHDSKCHVCVHSTGIGKVPLCAYIQLGT